MGGDTPATGGDGPGQSLEVKWEEAAALAEGRGGEAARGRLGQSWLRWGGPVGQQLSSDDMLQIEEEAEEAWRLYLHEHMENELTVDPEAQRQTEEDEDLEMEREFWDEGGHLSSVEIARVRGGQKEQRAA